MRMVIAILNPYKLDDVREAIFDYKIYGMTVVAGTGIGRQEMRDGKNESQDEVQEYKPNVIAIVLVSESKVDLIKNTIARAARTGRQGDGIVWDIPFEGYHRIRTDEFETNETYDS